MARNYSQTVYLAFQEVYSLFSSWAFSISFALFLFSMNAYVRNWRLLVTSFKIKYLWLLPLGSFVSTATSSLILLLLVSVLAGIVFSMSIFLIRRQIHAGLGAGLTGVVTGILAPACPSCALGLLGTLGLGGFLSVLPFKGLELGVLGIVILLVSIVYLSVKIETKVCSL